jgi:7-keto-8-aminopelargonate synthetase-like enzyme
VRWIFFVLLAANVVLLIGHYVQTRHQERLQALNSSPMNEGRVVSGAPLILVSELSDQQRKEMAKAKPAPAKAAAAIDQVATSKTQPSASADASGSSTDGKNLQQMLRDTAVVGPNQCFMLGPIPGAAQAEQISQRLMAIRIITDMEDLDVPGSPEYWVVLPSFPDEKQALQKLRELQGQDIPAQIIPKGELANAISFGLHGQQEDADKQAEQLNARGYRVQVKAVPVMHKEKWLALSERQTPKLNDAIWHSLQKDFPALEKHIKNCR